MKPLETFKLKCAEVKYIVDKERECVIAIASFIAVTPLVTHCIDTKGIAKVHNDDSFDIVIGKKVARAKAEKEAFSIYKGIIKQDIKEYEIYINKFINTIDKMENLIEHQKKYLKSF